MSAITVITDAFRKRLIEELTAPFESLSICCSTQGELTQEAHAMFEYNKLIPPFFQVSESKSRDKE